MRGRPRRRVLHPRLSNRLYVRAMGRYQPSNDTYQRTVQRGVDLFTRTSDDLLGQVTILGDQPLVELYSGGRVHRLPF